MFWVKTSTTALLCIYSIAKSIKSNQSFIIFVCFDTLQTSTYGALFSKSHYYEIRESMKTSSEMKAGLALLSKIHSKIF